MYELIQISDRCYYIESPAKIGLVRLGGNEVCLIDSGNDKDAGRKVRQILDTNSWKLTAIYNTHSNADHIGGNKYLQSQTCCRVFAPGIECCFTRNPLLEPSFLYGGFPPKDLRHKFLLAQECDCECLTEACLPEGFKLIPLPGHFFDMAGLRTPDDIVYIADCLSSMETLGKYQIGFIYDVGAYIRTLETLKDMKARLFVPSHAEVTDDIRDLAKFNIDKVNEIAQAILRICSVPVNFETVLQKLFREYKLDMNFEQYVLVGSTVRSYLAWLKDSGRVNVTFDSGMLLWYEA